MMIDSLVWNDSFNKMALLSFFFDSLRYPKSSWNPYKSIDYIFVRESLNFKNVQQKNQQNIGC